MKKKIEKKYKLTVISDCGGRLCVGIREAKVLEKNKDNKNNKKNTHSLINISTYDSLHITSTSNHKWNTELNVVVECHFTSTFLASLTLHSLPPVPKGVPSGQGCQERN